MRRHRLFPRGFWERAALAGALLLFGGIGRLRAEGNEDCLACHGNADSGAPPVHEKAFARSIHGRNLCVSCHTDATEIPHAGKGGAGARALRSISLEAYWADFGAKPRT